MLIDMVVCSIHSTVFMNRAVRLFSQQITKIVERVSDQCDWFGKYAKLNLVYDVINAEHIIPA